MSEPHEVEALVDLAIRLLSGDPEGVIEPGNRKELLLSYIEGTLKRADNAIEKLHSVKRQLAESRQFIADLQHATGCRTVADGEALQKHIAECRDRLAKAEIPHHSEPCETCIACETERNEAERDNAELRKRLASWGQSITVRNFLRDYANQCFQMQGEHDGAMSEECKKQFKEYYIFTRELIVLIQGSPCPLCKGQFDEIRGVFGCKVCKGSGLAQPGTPGEG